MIGYGLLSRALLTLLTVACSLTAHAHGGVSMEEDTCIMQIGPYRAHFTGYQPQVRASQEFCEDIPVVGEALIVLDYLNDRLRGMAVDLRVIRDVNGIGVSATLDDLGGRDAIEAATVFYEPAQQYARGSFDVALRFDAPGHFVGLVTASDSASGEEYVAVFPFAVGVTRWYSGWHWLALTLAVGALLYWQPWRRPVAARDTAG